MRSEPSSAKFVTACVVAVLNASAAIALGLHAAELLELPRRVQVAAVVVVALTAVVTSVLTAFQEYKGNEDATVAQNIVPHLRFALWAIGDAEVRQSDVGISVWTVKRQPPLVGPRRLRAFIRWPARYDSDRSGIDWRPGKGVHGRCVAQRKPASRDLGKDHKEHGDVDHQAWKQLPEEGKQGLSFKEFKIATGRYKYVAAAPIAQHIRGRDVTVGCLVIDVPSRKGDDQLTADELQALEGESVQGALAVAAGLVAKELP